ncbi:M48 family metallopeptidase [Ascidiimonas sp. W6]|uniref:M48 family metallopeptidase n=1 Tax=Ascidiimonas meishanensis TaxID=3128903 RepID=UPI0030EC900A
MRQAAFLFFFLGSICSIFSQEITQEKIQEIIENYKTSFDEVMVLKDCGHELDIPIMWTKNFENRTLDAMLSISDAERKTMGKKIFGDMNRKRTIVPNHWAKNDIATILSKITANLENSATVYKLNIIKSEEINAFATMGGYVYLTTGLLDFVDSYDELAFIIGHEVAHEEKLHTQRKVTKLLVSSNLLSLVKLDDFKKIALNINATLSAPFDQIDEYEADKYGVELAKKAGYKPSKFGDFFNKLAKYENKTLLNKLKSTHPFAEDRKNCIEEYITN